MSSSSEPRYVLRAEGVGKSFWRTEVLKSASLWALPGEVTTLMGRNGSGKTTLMKIAAGWLRPDYGMISFLGKVKSRWSLAEMAKGGLMFVPQEQLLSPPYKVRDHFRAVSKAFGAGRVEDALRKADLGALLPVHARTLSAGERMRVSLALVLARAPRVLLIDEPLAGLDPKDQEHLGHLLRTMALEGVAVITSGQRCQGALETLRLHNLVGSRDDPSHR